MQIKTTIWVIFSKAYIRSFDWSIKVNNRNPINDEMSLSATDSETTNHCRPLKTTKIPFSKPNTFKNINIYVMIQTLPKRNYSVTFKLPTSVDRKSIKYSTTINCKRGRKITEGQSNSQFENKMTTPWVKKIKRRTDK